MKVTLVKICECGEPLIAEVENKSFALLIANKMLVHDKNCIKHQGD